MKHFTLKLFLLVACLCGATSVWAEDWSIDFLNRVTADANVTISNTDVVTIGGTQMGTFSYNDVSIDPKFVLQIGTKWLMRTGGLYQFNGGGRAMGLLDCKKDQTITIVATGDPNPTTNVTLKSNSDQTYVYTVNEDGHVKFTPARYLYFKSIKVEDPVGAPTPYTVKYVDESGNTLKESKTYEDGAGSVPTVYNSDKEPIYLEGGAVKYSYYSDDAASKTIAEDGSTVVTVVFHAMSKYDYSVKNNFGDVIASGSAFEDETVNVYWSKYVNNDGKWFSTNSPYGIVISEATDYVVNYTTEEDIAYFFESENLKKSRSAAATNTGTSYSGGYSPRHYAGSYWYTDLIQPGTYKISVPYQNNNSGTTEFEIRLGDNEGNYDEEVIANWTGTGKTSATLEATITIPEGEGKSVYIYNNTDWNSNCYMDYVIFEKLSTEVEITPVADMITFCSPENLDFSNVEGLKAYIITDTDISDNDLAITPVDVVPAGTGVLLQGTKDTTYKVPVVVDEPDLYEGNILVAAEEDVALADGEAYILTAEGKFNLCNAGTLAMGKAYIPASSFGGSVKELSLSFAGATAINGIENAKTADNAIFNLAGQRVAQPTKGIYIVNGKKVFVK